MARTYVKPEEGPEKYEFFAPSPFGLSSVAAEEIRAMGIKVRPLQTGVSFFGTIADAYRVCLFARTVSHVLLILARFDVPNADALYINALGIPWEDHIPHGATIAVGATGSNDGLRNTQFIAVKLKDAICDRMRRETGERPDVDRHDADLIFAIAVRENRATVSLNLSGPPLHQRNYRLHTEGVVAPLKESLAAGVLLLANWPQHAVDGETFLDPMCGSGTLAIEAAMIAADIAPGLYREVWGFTAWKHHDEAAWNELLAEARKRRHVGLQLMPPIIAQDIDPVALDAARENAREAKLADHITFKCMDACAIYMAPAKKGLIATNPPYGERLFAQAQLPALYAGLSSVLKQHFRGWQAAIITPDQNIDELIGFKAVESTAVYNGRIPAYVRLYDCTAAATPSVKPILVDGKKVVVFDRNSQQFANRLQRRFLHMRKWARRNDIHCYRLYDADLPDFNIAIDLYESCIEGTSTPSGEWYAVLYEYSAPKTVDPLKAQRRLSDALAITPVVLNIDTTHLFYKQRTPAHAQDAESEIKSNFTIITKEDNLLFEVNLSDYLDTGLFLDHRIVRKMIQSNIAQMVEQRQARGDERPLRFLNLFAYTGTATVYAAAAGAEKTTSVDLSQTYLSRARRNMQLNGFTRRWHFFERADCIQWIREARRSRRRWDFIFVDPPAFSNSKKMGKHVFDVQRDHVELLISVSRLLERHGMAIFSCNLRSFKPDYEALIQRGVELVDVTESTIDEDFERNKKIHHCYLVKRVPVPDHTPRRRRSNDAFTDGESDELFDETLLEAGESAGAADFANGLVNGIEELPSFDFGIGANTLLEEDPFDDIDVD